MIIIGHPHIEHERFVDVYSIDDIGSVEASCIPYIKNENFLEIASHCCKNSVKYAFKTDNKKDALILNALNATYIIANLECAKSLQKLADEYMFDSKILCLIQSDEELEDVANEFIDGVIYRRVINGES